MMASCDSIARLRQVGEAMFGPRWQNAMARKIGVSRHTIYNWLSGKHSPPSDLQARLMAITTAAAAGAARLTSEIAKG